MPEITGTLKTPRLATAPSSPTPGQMYYDTSASKLYYWNGTAWVEGGSGGGSSVVISGTAVIVRAERQGDAVLPTSYSGPHGFPTETVDTDNSWDGTRFKPTKSGWYELRVHGVVSIASGQQPNFYLTKNQVGAFTGTTPANVLAAATQVAPSVGTSASLSATAIAYFNGTTDYAEVHAWMPDASRTWYGLPSFHSFFEASSLPSVGPKGDKGDPWVPSTYTLDTWHLVGAAGEPAFQNSWANVSQPTYAPLAFRKDPLGVVRVRGSIGVGGAVGAMYTVFTLPTGYRPIKAQYFDAVVGDGGAAANFLQVLANGDVQVQRSATSAFIDFTFDTDTVTTMLAGPQGLGLPSGGTSGSILQKKSATDYDTEWLTPANAKQVQHGGTATDASYSNLTTALPATGQRVDFTVTPGKYIIFGGLSAYYTTTAEVSWSIFVKRPEDAVGAQQSPNAEWTFNQLSFHLTSPPSAWEVTVSTAGTMSVWPAIGGLLSGSGDHFHCLCIPKDVTGPQGPQGDPWVPSTYTMDTWHIVGDATTGLGTAFKSASWSHYVPGQYPRVAFKKSPDGKVQLRGMMASGAAGVAFTLPAGYRPGSDVLASIPRAHHLTNNTGVIGSTAIDTNGDVTVAAATWLDFSAVEFDTDSVTTMLAGVKGDTGPRGPAGDAPVALPLDTWHTVGAAGEPAYQPGSSANAEGGAQFRKDPMGKVQLRGVVTCPATVGSGLFQLPVGYRPSATGPAYYRFSAADQSTGAVAYLYVRGADGLVIKGGGNTSVDLAPVEFDTDTVTTVLGGAQGPPGPAGSLNAPQYDSGWVLEQSASAHGTTLTHNLNLKKPPSNVEWWFAPTAAAQTAGDWFLLNLPNMKVTPAQTGADPYSNPGAVAFRTNDIFYYIYNGSSLYSYYSGGWVNWANGYYRVYLWA